MTPVARVPVSGAITNPIRIQPEDPDIRARRSRSTGSAGRGGRTDVCSIRRRARAWRLARRAALGLALAVAPATAHAGTYQFDDSEAAFDAEYLKKTIAVTGKVVDRTGAPVAGAEVEVIAFGDGSANAGRTTTTDKSGAFSLTGLIRRSVLLRITRTGFYSEIVPVDLHRPLAQSSTAAGTVTMNRLRAGRARLMFVGDTMFGRRFVDADQDGIEGEAGDLIRPASRAADAKAIVAYVRDVLGSADFAVANLECVVSADPGPNHPYKAYTFYSHPDTLAGLTHAGIDAVDLANNHIFDYLGPGVLDTIHAVAAHDLLWTGADWNEAAARDTTIRETVRGVPLSLQGFSALRKDGSDLKQYLLVALDPDKPGALEASAVNMADFLEAEAGESFAVPMIHGGSEYTSYPNDSMRWRFVDLVEGGAGIVVAHHTHTPQGVGLVDGPDGPRFVLMSLGNFIFDQGIFETTQSMIAVADVDAVAGGFQVARVELIPVHVEGYVPKLLAGPGLARSVRNLAHLSSTLPRAPSGSTLPDGLRGATVIPAGTRAIALRDSAQYTKVDAVEKLDLSVSGGIAGPIEYVRSGPADALARVSTSAAASVAFGRDILLYGDFEDVDVDGEYSEGAFWSQSPARYVQNSVVRSGNGAAVLLRKSSHTEVAELSNAATIPVQGGGELTLRGWIRGDNAGTLVVRTRFYDASGTVISTVDRFTRAAGTYRWTPFQVSFTAPAAARDLRISFRHSAPATGEGRAFVDDVAVVAWDPPVAHAELGVEVPAPNDFGFLRFSNVAAGVGKLGVNLTHRTFAVKSEAAFTLQTK
ncbi:MAG TPA: CapA family protein [Nannocystis sp.]